MIMTIPEAEGKTIIWEQKLAAFTEFNTKQIDHSVNKVWFFKDTLWYQ